jgi:hypothetical protein
MLVNFLYLYLIITFTSADKFFYMIIDLVEYKSLLKNMKSLVFILMYLILVKNTYGQNASFEDVEPKENGIANCHIKFQNKIIVGGSFFGKQKYYPSIMCIDTLGSILWNTALADTSKYSYLDVKTGAQKLTYGNDGYIYAVVAVGYSELWKIDALTGNIIWKKKLPPSVYNSYHYLLDYDATKLVVTYMATGNYNKMAFIHKTSGDTIYSKNFGSSNDKLGFGIDKQKNIYYTRVDSVYKLDANYPHNKLWGNKYPITTVPEYQGMYCDTVQNEIFCFGYTDGSFKKPVIVKINSLTGSFISHVVIPYYVDVDFQDMVVKNNFLYISWQHLYFGSGTYPYLVTKYNRTTGLSPWTVNYTFVGLPSAGPYFSNSSAAISIDVDSNDDVYATGYYAGGNYGPGSWGILKINGSSGNVDYEKTITNTIFSYNTASSGVSSCIINNQPYFIGNLETSHDVYAERSTITLVKLDPASGNVVLKKSFTGNYKFASRVLAIKPYQQNSTLVLSQIGRKVNLEMYGPNKNMLWTKELSKGYYLLGSNFSIAPNGEIYITARSYKEYSTLPYYYPTADSITIFKLDPLGNIINNGSFVCQSNASLVELVADNSSAYIFYQKNYSNVFYRKYNGASISNEFNANSTYVKLNPNITPGTPSVFYEQKLFVGQNASTLKYVTSGSSACSIYEIDKSTLASSYISSLWINKMSYVNFVYHLDSSRVIICGSNYYNKGAIVSYNTNLMDTLWTKVLSSGPSTQVIKCVADPQKNNFFSISSDSLNIVIRKHAISNGNQIWKFTYNGQLANQQDFPMDLAYDDVKKKLLVVGFQTINGKREALTIVLDSMGIAIDTIVKTGTISGNNEALCTSVLSDGTQWVGGYINENPEAGFIFEVESPSRNVWPGDANSDGIADNLDVLELGLHYTQTGTPRATTSNVWQSYFANNWMGTITNGKNLNHSDCNGDGIINDDDTLAIYNNYGLTHAFKPVQTNSVNPQLSIVPDQSTVLKGSWGTASIYLGDASTNINNVNGVAFTIDFDNTLIETNSIHIEYQNSFIDAGQNLRFRKLDFANGKVYSATTHTINNNASGYGKIATLNYQIKSDLTTDQILHLGVSEAHQSDAFGIVSSLTSSSSSLTATIDVGLQELNGNVISISPNPTNGSLTINSKTELQKIEVVSITGQILLSEVPTNVSHTLQLDNFANGICFLNVYQKDRVVKREKIVLNK